MNHQLIITLRNVHVELLQRLAEVCPGGSDGQGFTVRLLSEDPVVSTIVTELHNHGYQPLNRLREAPDKYYRLVINREYTVEDFMAATFLTFSPTWTLGAGGRPGSLTVYKPTSSVPKGSNSGIAGAGNGLGILVSDALRNRMVDAELKGASFLPLESCAYSVGQPWWELSSTVTMPSLSPTISFATTANTPVTDAYRGPIFPVEGWDYPEAFYTPAELHYRRDDVARLAGVDIALTAEQLYDGRSQQLIVSSRFYEFCLDAELSLYWRMVHIDE